MRKIKLCAFQLLACATLFGAGNAIAQTNLTDIFQNALTCALVEPFFAQMPVEPLYGQIDGVCSPVEPDAREGGYFNDATCQTPLPFESTSLLSHCEVLLDADQLGEGAGITTPIWTLSPGSRMDIGARSLEGVSQPYMQRLIYRTIDTPRGLCSLEMRVYTDTPINNGEVQQPSMLALHGGSWSARGFGFLGLELSIPHYVDKGFVVYAPFYRLLGDSEGSAACNQATIDDVADDASAALAWVRDRATDYGSSPTPVVFGQSAGAHLATSLLVNEPDKVAAAVLFYPPTDFTDFALRAQQGFYVDEQGLGILERLLGTPASEVNVNASPIPENSFPIRIVEQGIAVAPVLMVHGMRDALVEARQSARLCDALRGRELQTVDSEVQEFAGLRQSIDCGNDSTLQLIKEGEHALDICLANLPIANDLCQSGSDASRLEVSSAIADAVRFAVEHAGVTVPVVPVAPDENTGESVGTGDSDADPAPNSGGGASFWVLLMCGWFAFTRSRWSLCVKTL